MPILTYIPTKLNSELDRFKTNLGNIKIDYRSLTGSAPYLFSTPLVLTNLDNISFSSLPPVVPTTPHITSDNTNYRRYTTDIAVTTDDYQRNVVFLHLNGDLVKVNYKETIYTEETISPGNVLRQLEHRFLLVEEEGEEGEFDYRDYKRYSHLILNYEEVEEGFVDLQKVVKVTLDNTTYNEIYYNSELDVGVGNQGFSIIESTTTDYGNDGSIVGLELIPEKLKTLKYLRGFRTDDDSFKTNIIYSSSFSRNGTNFTSVNNSVLTDSFPNFYLYSKENGADQNVVGYIVNTSPSRGSLLHLVSQSDGRSYIYGNGNDIGFSKAVIGTEYTGLLSSPFLLLKFDFTSQTDTFKLKINAETEVVVGDYTGATFKYLCAKLSDLLYTHGILVIPCKNNMVAFDRFDGTASIELVFTSLYTKITTVPKFTSFEYLSSTKTITYDPVLHPVNFTFTYVDNINEVENYPLTYKLGIAQDTGRNTNYSSYRVRLKFDIQSVRNTTQAFKLEVEEGALDTTFTINDTDTIDTVLDTISSEINTFLPSNYSVEVSYLTSSIDIVNNQATETTYIKVTTGPWMTIDPTFGGVYVENPDGSKTIIMKPNDGSNTITTDTGIIAVDTASMHFYNMGVCTYNPVNGNFSGVTQVSYSSMFGTYCYALQQLNTSYRKYGYEAIPLFNSTTSDTSNYIGISKIVNNSSQTKPTLTLLSTSEREEAFNEGLYKSAKDMFMVSSTNGTRTKITKGNASIIEWKDKTTSDITSSRPFEIREVSPSLLSKTVTGSVANRDGIILTSIRPSDDNSYGNSYYNKRTLNIATGDPTNISSDLFLSLTQPKGFVSFTTSNVGDVYTSEGMGYKFDYNHATKTFTLTTSLELCTVTSLGFTQANDLVIDNRASWVKYPVGLNSSSDRFDLLETNPYIYMFIMSYSQIVDGV